MKTRAAALLVVLAVVGLTSCAPPYEIRMGLTQDSAAGGVAIVFDDDEARPTEIVVTDAATDEIVWSVDTAQDDPQAPPTIKIGQAPAGWTERTTLDGALPGFLIVGLIVGGYAVYRLRER